MDRAGQRRLLFAAALLSLTWAAYVAFFGGFTIRVLGVRVSSQDPFRALVAGSVLGAIALVATPFRQPVNSISAARLGARCAAALATLTFILGMMYGTFVAGAADAYGYVSQADLWAAGRVIVDSPLARDADWRYADWALTPLGYRPALDRGRMVPAYPPGLPIIMALFKSVAGKTAVYLVVPLCASLSIWLTYLFGSWLAGPAAGLLAAVALFASPVFLLQLMAPMSDIPAMTFWLLAAVLAFGAAPVSALVSGMATAVAILIRPNLVVLGIPMAILVFLRGTPLSERIRRLASWAVPAACGALAIAAIDTHLYGSPFSSGYDSLANLFSSRYAWTNVSHYSGWLLTTQTPFILLGLATAPWFYRLRDRPGLSLNIWALTFALCVALCYVWYLPFDNWSYLRFLLPAYPMLLATASAALVLWVKRYPRAPGIIAAVGLLLVANGLWQSRVAFGVREGEARYRLAGELTRRLPVNAVIIANLHSGSIRYYGGRLTVRYEWLDPAEYGAAIRYLQAHGHPVYVMLDDSEVQTFRERYAAVSELAWMNEPPLAAVANRVFLYPIREGSLDAATP